MKPKERAKSEPDRLKSVLRCPICKKTVAAPTKSGGQISTFFPFCSERCRLIDLGAWLDADYRIAAKPDEEGNDPLDSDPLNPN